MVVKKKGFLLQHFDKIICAVVALFFLGALVYVVTRTRGGELDEVVSRIEEYERRYREGAGPPPDFEVDDYRERWGDVQFVERPEDVREVFWPPFPHYYPEIVVGTEREHYLEFEDPIDEESVTLSLVEGDDEALEGASVEHPVHGNYSMVRLRTGAADGKLRVAARGGGRSHIKEVVADRTIDVPPEPPIGLATMAERGVVEVLFEPHPGNRDEVVVEGYRIFRRLARDLTGDFERVDTVRVHVEELTAEARRALEDENISPVEERQYDRMDDDEELNDDEVFVYSWKDRNVNPEEIYLYKIKTVGLKSSPRTSGFSETLRVETLPVMDFRFVALAAYDLDFEVFAEVGREVRLEEYEHFVGDRIGEAFHVERDEEDGEDRQYMTESVLLDVHRDALRRRPYATGRIVVVNRRGELESRWRNYWGTGGSQQYPWDPDVDPDDEEPDEFPPFDGMLERPSRRR